jgi:adenylate cyclase
MIDRPELVRCFQGIVPSLLATCSKDGEPNITYLSQVHYVDASHVALSRQFFNKTYRNVLENPFAKLELYDPLTLEAYRMSIRFERSETEGPLFELMSTRIDAIATLTGMAGVFKLIGSDVYEVLSFEKVPGSVEVRSAPATAPDPGGPLTELRGLQILSDRLNRAPDLEQMLAGALATMHELFGFAHSMILVPDEQNEQLYAIATHGYDQRGVGAEVPFGVGVIGTVAKTRRMLSIAVGRELRYGRAIRERFEETGEKPLAPQIALPGLPDAAIELAFPLIVGDRLHGVFAVESVNPGAFQLWHEAFLTIIGNQIAMGIDRFLRDEEEAPAKKTIFQYYQNDESIFVDGEYLIRNVPAKILWRLLRAHREEGRNTFTNRELRLDESLGLPALKDNLESRLILLKKRLAEKCPEVQLVSGFCSRFTPSWSWSKNPE